jgi:hypothetical protein
MDERSIPEVSLDARLSTRKEFDAPQRAVLADYGIETVGDLLGATRGLTDLGGLRAIRSDLPVAAVSLRATLPESVLESFAHDDTPMPSTGWISGEPER